MKKLFYFLFLSAGLSCAYDAEKTDYIEISNKAIELTTNSSNLFSTYIEYRYYENHKKFEPYYEVATEINNLVIAFDSSILTMNDKGEMLDLYGNTIFQLDSSMKRIGAGKKLEIKKFETSNDYVLKELVKMEIHLIKNELLHETYSMVNASEDIYFSSKDVKSKSIKPDDKDSLTFSLESDFFQYLKKRYIEIDSIIINGKLNNDIQANIEKSEEIAKIKVSAPIHGEYKIYGKLTGFYNDGEYKVVEPFEYQYNK